MAKYVLALDQGTTSSRAMVFDHAGSIVSVAQQEFPQIYPSPGLVEHDPEAIWSSQLAVAQEALKKAGASASDVAALGITNQRETAIVWDKTTGKPVFNAIVWQSRLTVPICDALKAKGFDKEIRERTGLVTDAYFSGTKVKWILDNVPGVREKAERGEALFGNVDTFLMWRLSKGRVHVTDPSNASRTLMYNIYKGEWDDVILKELGVPRAMLPTVMPSSGVFGETDPEFFGGAIKMAGDAGDQQAATFGQACYEVGMSKNTFGTGNFMLMNTGTRGVPSQNGLLTTIGWGIGGQTIYCLEGSIFITGEAVQWLRESLGVIKTSNEVETSPRSVPDTGWLYFVPASVGLGAPYWDSYARGTIVGMTRGSNAGHIARAALESIAFQSAELLHAMEQDSGVKSKELRVDGGAAADNLLMQFQSDLLGIPVVRPRVLETTALGAAYLAGLATCVWKSREEIASQWKVAKRFEPKMKREEAERRMDEWKRALERAKRWQQG